MWSKCVSFDKFKLQKSVYLLWFVWASWPVSFRLESMAHHTLNNSCLSFIWNLNLPCCSCYPAPAVLFPPRLLYLSKIGYSKPTHAARWSVLRISDPSLESTQLWSFSVNDFLALAGQHWRVTVVLVCWQVNCLILRVVMCFSEKKLSCVGKYMMHYFECLANSS